MVLMTLLVLVSITDTVPSPLLVTKTRLPSEVAATPVARFRPGWLRPAGCRRVRQPEGSRALISHVDNAVGFYDTGRSLSDGGRVHGLKLHR